MNPLPSDFIIPLTESLKAFEDHLNDSENKRVIVSAQFGEGKTFFLKNFFSNSKKYEAFHLYPINYSVSTNEDVFELIKFDILFHLLSKNVYYRKNTLDALSRLEWYVNDKPIQFIKSFISIANKLGQSLPIEVAEKLLDAYEVINKDYSNYVNENIIDEKKKILDYLNLQKQKNGSIYEEDSVTILINSLIDQLKRTDDKNIVKETVLIVDDLDRIDPEHIFRLLNVFASHFDVYEKENKFHFDKVIFVCDIQNIKQLFSVKYGSEVNFSGYIDKFYSKNVFRFDNTENILKQVRIILSTILVPGEEDENNPFRYFYSFKENNIIREASIVILTHLIRLKLFNVRSLLKLSGNTYRFNDNEKLFDLGDSSSRDNSHDIVSIFKFLMFVFGDFQVLWEKFNAASKIDSFILINAENSRSHNYTYISGILLGLTIAFIDIDNNMYQRSSDDLLNYKDLEKGLDVNYRFLSSYNQNGVRSSGSLVEIENVNPVNDIRRIDLFYFLKKALEQMNKRKIS